MNTVLMLKLNIVFCLLIVNFLLSFSSGGQTVLREGGNEGEAGNQLERKNINSEQKYCRKEASLTQINGPQIGAQTQVEAYSETNVKSEKSTKTESSDDTYSERCNKESQKLGNVEKSQKEQAMDKFTCRTVQLKGGNEGEAGNQLEENKPSKNVNSEKVGKHVMPNKDPSYSCNEVSMTPDSEPKVGSQTPAKSQADTDKDSESTTNTHNIISGHTTKESKELSIKISKNKYDKDSEVKYNPASIRDRGTERLQPLVAGGTQRIFRHPYGFFFQKESLPFQTHFKGTKEGKDFKKASVEGNKIELKADVSRKGVSAPKEQNEQKFKVNFASKKCGATIEGKNPEAENVNNIINSNNDEYLYNPCAANKKWFVIKLCETIYVKEIETGSFEFYSSKPRDISVDVSDRYPAKGYHSLGVLQLKEDRALQRFEIKKGDNYPAKYVKVEMLTNYGEEHICPLTSFKVYGKPVELDAYDGDQEEKYSKDNNEESNALNTGGNNDTDPDNTSSSEKIKPSGTTAEKTNVDYTSLVVITVIIVIIVAVLFPFSSILHSRRGFALNDQSQTRENDEILAQRPERLEHEFASASGNRCSSHDTPPNVTELEITSQSANQEHQETYDILLLHADEDRDFAIELKQQLTRKSISDTCTRFLNVILIEEFVPEIQSKLLTIQYVFKRCKYLFVLVTSNLKKDRLKRYQEQLALIDSIQNDPDRVIPIWAEHKADTILFEFSVLKGINCKTQKEIDFQVIKDLFKSA